MHTSRHLVWAVRTAVFFFLTGCASGDEPQHADELREPAAQAAPAQGDRLGAALAAYAAAHPCDSAGTCWLNPLPRGNPLRAVAGTGPNDVWLAGEGDALHFDGEQVRGYPTGIDGVAALYIASPSDVWAVGERGVARFDGTKFTLAMPREPYPSWETDIWATGPDNVYVALNSGVRHWDGNAWTLIPSISGRTIAGSGPDDVWVAGSGNGCWHFDGKTWSNVPEPAYVTDVLVRAPNDVWMVTQPGRYTTMHHFDGTQWTREELRQGPGFSRFVQGNDGHIWTNAVARYDGTNWTRVGVTASTLAAVGESFLSVSSNGHIHRITSASVPVATDLVVGITASLYRVWASSGTDAWAVGANGAALHYDGARVHAVDTSVRNHLDDLRGTAHDDVWSVGTGGTIVHWDGARWTRVDGQTTSSLGTVHPVARGEAWIGGRDGVLLHATPTQVNRVVLEGLPEAASILDIGGAAADDLWLAGSLNAGASGFLAHFDGTTWSRVLLPAVSAMQEGALTKITAHASNDVWIEVPSRTGRTRFDYSWHWDGTRMTAVWRMPSGAPRLTEEDFATRPSREEPRTHAIDGRLFEVGPDGRFTYRLIAH
ncbi:MAG: hypothetical protein ABW252_11275 [Polyangiales bacterium]